MRQISSIIFVVLGLFGHHANACSSIVLKNDNNVFLAKNFDWTYGDGLLIKNVRGVHKTAFYTSAGTPVSWVSKYGSVTFNQNGKEMPYGGMNEQGLAIEMLWLDYTEYYSAPAVPYINELEWIQYQLDNYATVEQVVANMHALSIRPFKGKIHFIVADAAGNSTVIEHIGGKIIVEKKQAGQCQAITNYDLTTSANWHANKTNAGQGNVAHALFRYTRLQSEIDQKEFVSDLSEKTAFNMLDDVTIKKGHFKTYWTIVYDLKKQVIHFKSSDAKNVKHLALNDLDFLATTQYIDINLKKGGDATALFGTYTEEINTALITNSLKKLGLEQLDFAAVSKHQMQFLSDPENSYTRHYAALKIAVTTDDSTKLGRLGIVIVDNEENLKNFKPFRDGMHEILLTGTSYSWMYYGLPQGSYAIAAARDTNNNRRPDFEQEKYAFSRGARVVEGNMPSFDAAKIDLTEGVTEIRLVLK